RFPRILVEVTSCELRLSRETAWQVNASRVSTVFSLFMRSRCLLLAILVGLNLWAQQGDEGGETQTPRVPKELIPPAPPLPPEQALKSFKVQPGFRIELVAAEPLVHDPIQIAFDPNGRLWVLEMRGYMTDIEGNGELEKVGSVVVLEDTDGDGRMDKQTMFLDGLVMPRALSLA